VNGDRRDRYFQEKIHIHRIQPRDDALFGFADAATLLQIRYSLTQTLASATSVEIRSTFERAKGHGPISSFRLAIMMTQSPFGARGWFFIGNRRGDPVFVRRIGMELTIRRGRHVLPVPPMCAAPRCATREADYYADARIASLIMCGNAPARLRRIAARGRGRLGARLSPLILALCPSGVRPFRRDRKPLNERALIETPDLIANSTVVIGETCKLRA
jgi:hypothetical protein